MSGSTHRSRRYLLDTHIWLWMLSDPDRLGTRAKAAVINPGHELLLSAASVWEIAIKSHLGKLVLPEPPRTFIPDRVRRSGVISLPIEHDHALRVADLPDHHRDPFDRVLVAQAQALRIPIISADAALSVYDIRLIS